VTLVESAGAEARSTGQRARVAAPRLAATRDIAPIVATDRTRQP
jgi:hypothetical protein